MMITLGTVNISNKTKELMAKALNKGIIGQGEYIGEFEKKLANFLGVKQVIAVANGTLADACALAAAKYKDSSGRNEVIVPALTFISQINAIYYNHLKPVFVDVGYDCEINIEKIEEKIFSKDFDFIFEGGKDFPLNLTGAIAGWVFSRFNKPTFIFSRKDNLIRGSIRSPQEIDSVETLKHCSSYLEIYGGHPQAAGFTVKKENLEKFKECLKNYFKS